MILICFDRIEMKESVLIDGRPSFVCSEHDSLSTQYQLWWRLRWQHWSSDSSVVVELVVSDSGGSGAGSSGGGNSDGGAGSGNTVTQWYWWW